MKAMMFAMLVACAALAGCTTPSTGLRAGGTYGRPINPADGGAVGAVATRVSAIEAKETGWNTGSTAGTNAQVRVGAVEANVSKTLVFQTLTNCVQIIDGVTSTGNVNVVRW